LCHEIAFDDNFAYFVAMLLEHRFNDAKAQPMTNILMRTIKNENLLTNMLIGFEEIF